MTAPAPGTVPGPAGPVTDAGSGSELPATGATPSRADRRRARRIDDILRTATGLLAERGYAATSLDEIAEMLDLSKASLYHYFPSKEDLILACLDRVGDETSRRLREAAASALPPRDRLRAAVRAQVLVLTRDQAAGAALYLRDVGLPEAARARLRTFVEQHNRALPADGWTPRANPAMRALGMVPGSGFQSNPGKVSIKPVEVVALTPGSR